eukprot:CAMPEP_0181248028 /NCGR_PEP_ID=MMETSP1096-20121128/44941_1 /TAXON_ID=156174 ORGANISM="Chrysochromulina ericina, Strain CCMP281" /NCGR_SAMPLE_ID=MMETSP1096 /ASSEMBLY_ACC=CAM_ASM_000453 /LENGTH=141 /DNA_ID=CAMNT_0023345149 /DNA_START=353 /DNA_END=774 /DNA_ORIENTATION=+
MRMASLHHSLLSLHPDATGGSAASRSCPEPAGARRSQPQPAAAHRSPSQPAAAHRSQPVAASPSQPQPQPAAAAAASQPPSLGAQSIVHLHLGLNPSWAQSKGVPLPESLSMRRLRSSSRSSGDGELGSAPPSVDGADDDA